MKRIIAFILAITMMLALCACGGNPWEEKYLEAAKLFYEDADYDAAFEALAGAEDSGYAPTLRLLGQCYFSALGTGCNYEKAFELLEAAYEQGDMFAAYFLATIYNYGYGGDVVDVDKDKAYDLYSEFVKYAENMESNDDPAFPAILSMLGYCYATGRGVEADGDAAIKYIQKAADLGYVEAYCDLGYVYLVVDTVENDEEKALECFTKAAELGNSEAMYYIGHYYFDQYYFDLLDEPNYAKALEWWLKAAARGNSFGMGMIGYMYEFGVGVEKNVETAVNWYEEAIAAGGMGAVGAMYDLGSKYYTGEDLEQDYSKAFELIQSAAEVGSFFSINAMDLLGDMYMNGEGVEKDEAKAQEWYEKSQKMRAALVD